MNIIRDKLISNDSNSHYQGEQNMLISFIGMTMVVYAVILISIFYKIEDRTTTRVINKFKNALHISKKQTAL
jgi:hypothetical protein